MENIDSWEVISDEKMGAYLSDKRDSINISNFDDGIDARYSYETEVEKKDYRDYFGKIQHNYKDLKRNPLSTFSRNAWNGLLDLPKGLGDAIIGAGEYVAFKATGGDPEFEKKLAEGANALRAKNDEWFKQWQYVNNQQDNSFVADLGRAGGSLLSSLGLTFITKNPSVVAGAFGASQFGSINKELRERGVDIDRALAISTGLGLAEGALERVGLHLWFENAATKKISTYLLKQGATEFTQEASQTAVEEVSMKLLGERNTEWFDIVKNVIYSGVIGGITGIGGGAVSIPSTEAFKQQAKEKLVEKGFTEEKAQQLVDDAAYSNDEARRDLLELVNKEADQSTLLNGSYEDDVKAFAEAMQQDIVSEAFDIKQELKEKAMTEGGLDEETAEVASTLVENFTKAVYNKTGITPRDLMDEKGLTLIDESYPSPQDEVINESELTEEEIARLKQSEEFDIPFQTDQLRPGDKGYDIKADINTPEFKKWSGGSEVVTPEQAKSYNFETGKAVTVEGFHGGAKGIKAFSNKYALDDNMFFFTSNEGLAKEYREYNISDIEKTDVYNVYLTMKKPLVFQGKKSLETLAKILHPDNENLRNEWLSKETEYWNNNIENSRDEAWYLGSTVLERRQEIMDYALKNGYDGIIDYEPTMRGAFSDDYVGYIVFNPNQIKSVYNRGTFSPESDNIYYQSDDRELVVTHGTTLKKLEDALELGAMPMPSLAITKYQNVNNQYGEILFVGGSDVLKGDSAFAADIYSTRRVYPEFSLNKDGDKFIENITDKYSKKGKYFWISNIESELERGGNGYMLKALYLAEKGELTDLDGSIFQVTQDMTDEQELDFSKWEKDFVKKYTDKKILTGYTPSGNKKYVSYDLANVLNIMKKSKLRGSENISSGNIHALRGVWAKELKTIEEIKKEKGRLSDNETYKKFTEAMDKDADNLINLLMTEEKAKDLRASYINYYDYVIDEALMLIKPNSNIKNILKKAELRSDKEAVDAVKNFIDVVKATPAKYFEAKPQRAVDFYEFNGVILPTDKEYDEVANKLSERGLRVVRSDNQKQALQEFNDVFFQGRTVRRGSYNPTTQVIRLFKEANPSTIIHELGHFFTMKYVRLLEENGQRAELDGFYNWLGINSIDEATTETWEKMARGFETYALEGVAPNVSTESVFQRLKQWLVGVYQDLKGKVIPPEEINDDVREFFDGMLASEQTPIDVSNIKGRTDDLINIINSAIKGEEVSIDGLSLKDVKDLIKASNARLPRMPKNLEQAIRSAGGIDVQLAKSLGLYDERKGNLSGFFKEGGAFTKEDSLIEFLKSEGFLSVPESVTYEQTAEMADKAISLLENASQIFRESDLGTVQQRESMAEAAQEAAKLLSKIDYKEVQQALQTLQDKSITGIQNDTLRYIKSRLKRIDSDYRKILNKSLTNQRKDIAQKQTDVINYIKEQPISNEHKFRLINEVKKANKETAYENAIKEVKRRAEGYYEQEQKKILASQIKKEIRKSKPSKVTQQRYDYETNKLFQALREYNKFNQEQASEELNKFIDEEMSNVDLIKMRFLNYKANGMSSSTQLMEKVLDDILQAKRLGIMLKDQAEMEAKINKEELKQEAIAAIQANTADKDKFKTKFTNLYRRGFTNLYSMINSISSRKLAERFEMETVLNDADVTYYRHTDTFTKKAMDIFGVKSRGDLLNKFADMGEVVDTIYAENGNRYDLTKLDIVDIYNAIKNEKTRANYLAAYGEEQVMRVLNLLNQQERFFADAMMEDINSLYPETNKVYVETYGMDLKKVENYWPATSDRIKETDLLGDFYAQQETPSFYKERVKGRVTPLPKNAWEKYLKHVNESIYMVKVARKYKELSDTFKSSRVRNQIENKYGKAVYNELMEQINSISLNSKSASLNYVESAFGSMLNNFVVAKIAVAPTVFAGQLTSITNYSEEVNTVDYYKNFVYGLSHPKEVISFMKKHAGDFLETRYKGGYSEALTRVQREAEQANKRKFKILSDKAKYNVTNALTSFVRVGDLGAIMFGGYAEIQSNLKSGMSLEDAIKKFEFDTLRSQQSSNAASLSSFQKSTGFSRVLLAFKNTQHQYFRKIVDSIIQYQRGEINATQCAKTILNYAVIQGSLYIIAKNAVKAAMGLDDDDDELTDGLLEQLLVGNLDAIPFLSDIAHYAYKRASGEFAGSLLSMPGLDDIERAIMKLYKEDKTIYDWVDVIAPLIEGTTATPVKRYTGMLKKYLEDE